MTTPRRSMKNSIIFGAVLATAGAALILPSAASAATPTTTATASTSTSTLPLGQRLQRACQRIPNLEARTSKFITRLNADATTRGSLLWLQAQIDDAKAKGRTQLATVLENRLTVRTQTLKVLTQRQTRLEKLADLCRQHGVDS